MLGITIYDTDGTTAVASVKVTIRNERTNETQTGNTDSSGQVIFNLANFTSGWTVGDIVTYFVFYNAYAASASFTTTNVGGDTKTLTLSSVTESTLKYFTVQDFLDTFGLSTYDQDNVNGIKPQTIVIVGESIEREIEQVTNMTWDDNDGSYYTATEEMHNAGNYQSVWFTNHTPIVSLTNFYVNAASEGSAANWVDIADGDAEDLNTKLSTGRIDITDGAQNFPEPGHDQVKITYTYGQTTPSDIKRLAILMTARAFGSQMLGRLNITTAEASGLSSAIQNLANFDKEIDRIIENRRFAPIANDTE